jgi:hypothetical protein
MVGLGGNVCHEAALMKRVRTGSRGCLLWMGCVLLSACGGEPEAQTVSADDVPRFWQAYDEVVAAADSSIQVQLLDSLFVERGSPGLVALMERRRLTPEAYVESITRYPRFWESVRRGTLRADQYARDIAAGVRQLRDVYPELRPAGVYFTIGTLLTPGMTLDDIVFIGSELALGDSAVVTEELPEPLRTNLRAYFDSRPADDVVFLNIHEYVHTQQGPFGDNLLAVALQEGVAEFVAALALGLPSPTPAVAFGNENEPDVKDRFASEMFSPNWNDWLYNDFSNQFGVRDLGYYVGYAIAERYVEGAENPKEAVAALIELDYQDPDAVERVVEASGYFDAPLRDLRRDYLSSTPEVVEYRFGVAEGLAPEGPAELEVTFSRPMSDRFRGFDFGPLGESRVIRVTEVLGWSEDGRTLTVRVDLPARRPAQLMLTSQFRSVDGAALQPFLVEAKGSG